MKRLSWQPYKKIFQEITEIISINEEDIEPFLSSSLNECTRHDPSGNLEILGVSASLIAYLEYLFHEAEGPYSQNFKYYADVITKVFMNNFNLRDFININSADTLANMILNRRGKLKFLIADQFELFITLQLWKQSGLIPVYSEDVLDAVLNKPTIRDRIEHGDPELIIRLIDVFPGHHNEINPHNLTREELINTHALLVPPPSERRYKQVLNSALLEGKDLRTQIKNEEHRVLPMQMRRNRFLAFLVREYYHNACQICSLIGETLKNRTSVHHIIPLSEGGKDTADNMFVTCKYHHQQIHAGDIRLCLNERYITIFFPELSFKIKRFE